MAYEIPGQRISVEWGTTEPASTASQFRMYVLNGSGNIVLPASTEDNQRPLGILQNVPPSTASPGAVMINGVSKIKASGSTLAAGDAFACSTDGFAIPVAGGAMVGFILEGTSSTADSRIMTGVFLPYGSSAA